MGRKEANRKICVEVGPGNIPQKGYIHCDIFPGKDVDYVCNAWEIPFKEESVDEIYARHVLEHLTASEAKRTLRHWLAVLKVKGRVRINVPDLGKHIEQFHQEGLSPYVNFEVTNRDHALAGFYGWQKNPNDIHKWGYTFVSLSGLLKEIGFDNIKRIEDKSLSGPLNIYLSAEKLRTFPGLKRDPDSLKPRLFFINRRLILRKVLRRLKRYFLKIVRPEWIESKKNKWLKEYGNCGERQVSKKIKNIRKDHVGRYKLACQYIKENDVVLDCACGVGYGSFILTEGSNLKKIIGIDIDSNAITFAEKYFSDERIEYINRDIFDTNIEDNHFDVIVSFETLEHVDASRLLSVFSKILKRGGLLIVSSPNQDRLPFDKKKFPFHLRHYSPGEYKHLLESNFFRIVKKYTQYDMQSEEISAGWDGLFNIAVAKNEK